MEGLGVRLNLSEALALLGAIHGVFLGIVLWTQKRGNRLANRVLAFLVGLFSVHLLHIVLYWTRALALAPHFWGSVWFLPYVYGPLLYLYGQSLLDPTFRLTRRHVIHSVPFVACVLLFSRFYVLPEEIKSRLLEASYEYAGTPSAFALTIWGLQFVHFSCYLGASLRALPGAADADAALPSRWIRRLMAAFAASFSCWFFYGMSLSFGVPYSRSIDYLATVAMTVSIYAIGYTALRAPELFIGDVGTVRLRRAKYQGSPLTDDKIAEYRERLLEVMESSRPHVDANLRLPDLAGLLQVSSHQLSQVLNQGFGQRFNDFVNRYRVEEAMRLMSDPTYSDESLLSLAFQAGFNNKTSFNQAFKKYTRMTPSSYRERNSRQDL